MRLTDSITEVLDARSRDGYVHDFLDLGTPPIIHSNYGPIGTGGTDRAHRERSGLIHKADRDR